MGDAIGLRDRAILETLYAIEGDEIVVVSIWGAPKRRGPKL